jgi:O-antigen/teichoic acid export membrane protein
MMRGEFKLKGCTINCEQLALDKPGWKSVLMVSWPFGVAGLAHLIYYQSNIVLLKYLDGDYGAGIYNICFLVLSAVYLFPGVIYQKFLLPKLHRWAVQDRDRMYEVFRVGNIAMLIAGVGFMSALYLVSDWVVVFVFGVDYESAADLLKLLSLSVPPVFVALSAGSVLVTQDHMLTKVKLMVGVAVFNVLLNMALIPENGVYGAAQATIFSNIVLSVLYYLFAKNLVFKDRRI